MLRHDWLDRRKMYQASRCEYYYAELTKAASTVSILPHLSVLPSQRLLNLDLIEMPQDYVNK